MTPKDRLRQLQARAQRLRDVVLGLGDRRRDARATMQRAVATVREYEAWRGPEPATPEVLAQAREDAAEAEETYKRLDSEWAHDSARLTAAQQLAGAWYPSRPRCRVGSGTRLPHARPFPSP